MNVAVATARPAAGSAAPGYGATGWLVGATAVLAVAQFLVGPGEWRCRHCREAFSRTLLVDRCPSCRSTATRRHMLSNRDDGG